MPADSCSLLHQSCCAACGKPVSVNDEGGCVGTDPGAYHFKADCLLEAARREHAENERLRELYENAVGNRKRFGWTINHLLECDEALGMAEAGVEELRSLADGLADVLESLEREARSWLEPSGSYGNPAMHKARETRAAYRSAYPQEETTP